MAILLTVWAVLIASLTAAYVTVRWTLIQELDNALVAKASSLPGLTRSLSAATREAAIPTAGSSPDRIIVKNAAGQNMTPPARGLAISDVTVVSASFVRLGDGSRWRNLTLSAAAPDAQGVMGRITIVYQGSAEHIDSLLSGLGLAFAAVGLCAGGLTAWVSMRMSRLALSPIFTTAKVIETIDPQNLHRRIDVTRLPVELSPMAARLNEMLGRLERGYEQRQRFLTDASHELRTPVAAMMTTLEVSLLKPRDAANYKEALKTCLADARLLRTLVERLMEQSRSQSYSHDEPAEQLDIVPLLNQCAEHATVLGNSLGVKVSSELPGSLLLRTQPQRLRSVVMNLLGNAVEYNCDGGRVQLSVIVLGSELVISVQDNGPGIAEMHLPHLFEPFYRVDASRTDSVGHLGLGLSLVAAHVQALGGVIEVKSVPGRGSVFKVSMPIGIEAPANLLQVAVPIS